MFIVTDRVSLDFKRMCIYFNENCVLVTNFKTWGFVEHFLMESGNANVFRLTFTTEKVDFKQKYFVNKTPSKLQNHLLKRPCLYFSRVLVTSYRFYFTKLNFLSRRCREIKTNWIWRLTVTFQV